MDDSDQDFEDFSPKRLRRVRKPGEAGQARKAERQTSSQASEEDKRRRNNKKAVNSIKRLSWTQPAAAAGGGGAGDDGGGETRVVNGEAGHQSGDAWPLSEPLKEAGPSPKSGLRAKDKVLLRMKQFKRDSPQKMVHKNHTQTANHENNCTPFTQQKNQGEMTRSSPVYCIPYFDVLSFPAQFCFFISFICVVLVFNLGSGSLEWVSFYS